jgi:hypothetical protein
VPALPRHLCARHLLLQLCVPVGYEGPSVNTGLVVRLFNQQAARPEVLCRALSTSMRIYNVQGDCTVSVSCGRPCQQ